MPGNSGNARDTRQRGNAAQLLEKYKNMARDSQLAGDRVQTEYYLQFADHYFRVLGESRVRFEEQRRQHGDDDGDEDGDEMMDADSDSEFESDQQPRRNVRSRDDRPEREANRGRDDRPERDSSRNRDDRPEREAGRDRDDRPERAERPERRERRPAGNGRSAPVASDEGQRMPFDALPPAIGIGDQGSEEATEAEAAPRVRRTRRVRPADNSDDASASADPAPLA